MIRAFIALELSKELKKNLRQLMDNLKTGMKFTSADPRWIRIEGIHLTLKFLGNIEQEMIPHIKKVLQRAASRTAPFTLKVRNLGVFPNPWNPKVLWTGVSKGDEDCMSLQRIIEKGLMPLGFEKEKRPFHPHLTLARIKSSRGVKEMMSVVKSHKRPYVGECLMDRVILFKSQLNPQGAIYTKLAEVPLTGREVSKPGQHRPDQSDTSDQSDLTDRSD